MPVLLFLSKPGGVNTVVGANQLTKDQLVVGINWYYDKAGALTTRAGLTPVTTTKVTGAVIAQKMVNISGTNYHLVQDSDYNLYKKLQGGLLVKLGTLDGNAQIIQFNSKAILLDGGYLKEWSGTTVTLCYDKASYLIDDSDSVESGEINFSVTVYKVGNTVTLPVFGTTSMPVVQFKMSLKKTGSPTGAIKAVVALASDYSIIAETAVITNISTGTLVTDAGDIAATATEYRADFDSGLLESGETYVVYFEYLFAGGDYISVSYADGGKLIYNDSGAWISDTAHTAISAFGGGLPPKATMGVVSDYRLHLAGSPDYPGHEYYSNVDDNNDWSTNNGSGWIGVIDNDPFNYPVGGMIHIFGSIWLIGSPEHPYFVKLTGTGPSDYAMTEMFMDMETSSRTVVTALNDGLFASSHGVFSVSGVNKYGDLQFSNLATNIRNVISDYYGSNAVAGYNKDFAHYWLQLTGSPYVLIGHKDLMSPEPSGGAEMPWTMFRFSGRTPTSFLYNDGVFYIGFDDGYIYSLDEKAGDDAGTKIEYDLLSGINEIALQETVVSDYYISGTVYGNRGEVSVRFFAGDDATGDDFSLEPGVSFESGITIGSSAYYNEDLDTSITPYNRPADYVSRQLQVGITNHRNVGRFYLTGVALQMRNLSE